MGWRGEEVHSVPLMEGADWVSSRVGFTSSQPFGGSLLTEERKGKQFIGILIVVRPFIGQARE